MDKRIKLGGFIDLPEGAELPAIGDTIHAEIVAEVTGSHTNRQKREADGGALIITVPTTALEGSKLTGVDPASGPLDEALENA